MCIRKYVYFVDDNIKKFLYVDLIYNETKMPQYVSSAIRIDGYNFYSFLCLSSEVYMYRPPL